MDESSPTPAATDIFKEDWRSDRVDKSLIALVNNQIQLHQEAQSAVESALSRTNSDVVEGTPSLFDIVTMKLNQLVLDDESAVATIAELADPITSRAIDKLHALTYTGWCTLKRRHAVPTLPLGGKAADNDGGPATESKETSGAGGESATEGSGAANEGSRHAEERSDGSHDSEKEGDEIDEWIIQNEEYLRAGMQRPTSESDNWGTGLVRFSSDMDVVLPSSTLSTTARKVIRPSVAGYTILDALRDPFILLQPSLAQFESTFDTMTGGILKGMNWDNVFVAGGIVLGGLLLVNDPECPTDGNRWESSDIDLYIYTLDPPEANAKIRHIFEVFNANLPEGRSTLVVRNSKTITFLSEFPTRRIQIILKKVKHPKQVLLNFDLDICAVGYDGKEVWMLPRAVRALETGNMVFTMDMIEGHYLSNRRETHEQRVFKYAYKGYGLRFLDSYIKTLPDSFMDTTKNRASDWTNYAVERFDGKPHDDRKLSHAYLDAFDFRSSSKFPMHHGQYDDSPTRWDLWDEGFNMTHFKGALDDYNNHLLRHLRHDVHNLEPYEVWRERKYACLDGQDWKGMSLSRTRYGHDIDQMLDSASDIVFPLFLPEGFLEFALDLLRAAHMDHGLPFSPEDHFRIIYALSDDVRRPHLDVLVLWRITTTTMWQQFDHGIDELFEVLWSLRRTSPDVRNRRRALYTEAMRRLQKFDRPTELKAFKEWALREAHSVSDTARHHRELKDDTFSDGEVDDRGVLIV